MSFKINLINQTKNSIISESLKKTRQRHENLVCKTFELKVDKSHLSKEQLDKLNLLFIEAKWLYNHVLNLNKSKDFDLFKSKPYFNHFTQFIWDTEQPFEQQLKANFNGLLLTPERPIEVMFLVELPDESITPKFYDILDYFSIDEIAPVYGVVHNPELAKPQITVSMLYSRKPRELVEDFKSVSDKYTRNRIKKSLEQHVVLQSHKLDKMNEARRMVEESGSSSGDVLGFLKRIGKL